MILIFSDQSSNIYRQKLNISKKKLINSVKLFKNELELKTATT